MKITEQAQVELKKALDSFNQPDAGIHVYITQGCCGPAIQMDVAGHLGIGETIVTIDGIDFFVYRDLLPKIVDVTIEFGSNGFRLTGLKKASTGCCG